VDRYVGPYIIDEVVLTNAIKLRLPTTMRIHPVINISQVAKQKVEKVKPVEVEGVEKWKIEKILNKRKVREVVKYLV